MNKLTIEINGRGIFFTGTPEAIVTMLRHQWNEDREPGDFLGPYDTDVEFMQNVSIAMTRLGARSAPALLVGADPDALVFLQYLRDVKAITITAEDPVAAAAEAETSIDRVIREAGL